MKPPSALLGLGPLTIVALFLSASGSIRLGQGFGAALALQTPTTIGAASAPLNCPEPPERLLAALNEREATVSRHEAALNDRLAALDISNKAISARMQALAEAEKSLRDTLAIADGAAEKDLARLTAVYEAMKPSEAARLFEAMAPEFAAGFLGRMRPDSAAAVLSGMKPEAAYSISVLVAGRNASAPRE